MNYLRNGLTSSSGKINFGWLGDSFKSGSSIGGGLTCGMVSTCFGSSSFAEVFFDDTEDLFDIEDCRVVSCCSIVGELIARLLG